MLENESGIRSEPNAILSVLLLLLLAALGFVFGSLLVFYIYLPFYGGSENQLMQDLQSIQDGSELKLVLYAMQGGATIGGLLIAPFIFFRLQRRSFTGVVNTGSVEFVPVLMVFFLLLSFMALNSIFIKWNENVHFPEFLKGFENWAREREDAAAEQTEALTKMNSPIELIIALVVIAILPAIGEELVFRGIIQRELHRGSGNIHIAIWVSAILFSAIHIQFFGFVPRMLLGALFGYLYYWSGNLWLAILAHFVNNGLSVVGMYFYQKGSLDYDIDSTEAMPANVIIVSAILTGGLLYYFYKYFENRKSENYPL
jgi:membrane protease YdiL (CAAX protease family)